MNTVLFLTSLSSLVLCILPHFNGERTGMGATNLAAKGGRQDSAAVRLTVVYDNNPLVEGLETDWGFACFVEVGETEILFDTGGDGALLLDNMAKLGISPGSIDAVVISHVHHDHLRGLKSLLLKKSGATVYVPRTFPPEVCRDIELAGANVIRTSPREQVNPRVSTLGLFETSIPEQALVVRTGRGLAVITGCAHPGIVEIVQAVRTAFPREPIHFVMGGFHLGRHQSGEISAIADTLRELGVQRVAPCHCSGDAARRIFREAFGENYLDMGVGGKIQIGAR